jgi:hypothetical protein
VCGCGEQWFEEWNRAKAPSKANSLRLGRFELMCLQDEQTGSATEQVQKTCE